MTVSQWLTVAGLALDIVGTTLVAYEFIWGGGARFQAQLRKNWLERLKEREYEMTHYYDLENHPPHAHRAIERMHAAEIQENDKKRKALYEELSEYTEGHADRVSAWGMAGFISFLMGFCFQIVGVISQ